jgi:GT2 family glycosyltransferase
MKLSIIIVNFNTKEFLKKCLESIYQYIDISTYEIIVVDNGSIDGSAKMVKEEFPKVKLIENSKNLGFAKAVNQGIRKAKGEYIFLLNPDTEIKRGTLKKLIEFAGKNPDAGVIGAKLLNPNSSIQSSVYHFPTIWRAIKEFWFGQRGAYEKYAPAGMEPVEVDAVTGAAMLIPRKTIEKIGLFDERYFMYFEDLDYCRRVKKAGLKVYYLPEARIIHHHGKSGLSVHVYSYLVSSSKIYNGIIKYYLLTFIIWLGQKFRNIFI